MRFSTLIKDIFHIEDFPMLPVGKTRVGIEVEVENFHLEHPVRSEYWTFHNDPSLRNNGIELVSMPLPYPIPKEAIIEFRYSIPSNTVVSHRTGLHVHLDMRYSDVFQLIAFIEAYAVVEDILFQISGGRNSNIYCVSIKDDSRNALSHILNGKPITNLALNEFRYGAFNLSALAKYGTIEFRHAQGTTSWKVIQRWVDILVSLWTFSNQWSEHRPVTHYKGTNLRYLFSNIFGNTLDWNDGFAQGMAEGISWVKCQQAMAHRRPPKILDFTQE